MKKTGKRIISILLSALMVVSMIPTFALSASAYNTRDSHLLGEYLVDDITTGVNSNSGVTWDSSKHAASFNGTSAIKLNTTNLMAGSSVANGFTVSFDVYQNDTDESVGHYFYFTGNSGDFYMISSHTTWWDRYRTNFGSRGYYTSDFNSDYCTSWVATNGDNGYMNDMIFEGNWYNIKISMAANGALSYYIDDTCVATYKTNYGSLGNGNGVSDSDVTNIIQNLSTFVIGAQDANGSNGLKGYLKNFRVYDAAYDSLSNSEKLITALDMFESKMDGTIYKNMGAAYSKYVAGYKSLDSFLYGDQYNTVTEENLATIATQLKTEIGNMSEWSAATTSSYGNASTAKVYENDSGDGSSHYSNAIWLQTGVTADTDSRYLKNSDHVYLDVYYPCGVFLYDGTNTIKTTFVIITGSSSSTYNVQRYAVGADIHNSNLSMVETSWKGSADNLNCNSMLNGTSTLGTDSKTSAYQIHWGSNSFWNQKHTNYWYRFATEITFSSELTGNEDKALTTITPNFSIYCNSSDAWTTTDTCGALKQNCNKNLYVINYKKLTDRIVNSSYQTLFANIWNYRQGGASEFLTAYDALTAVDPNTTMSGATTSNYGTKATTICDAIDTAVSGFTGKTFTSDTAESINNYKALRSAIKDSHKNFNDEAPYNVDVDAYTVYHDSNYNASTISNYASFASAYEAATLHMASLATGPYNSGNVAKLATNLSEAFDSLVVKGAVEPSILGETFIGKNESITITNNDTSGASVYYSIVYDGDSSTTVNNSFYGESSSVNIFNNSTDYTSAVLTAWAQKGSKTSNSIRKTFINEDADSESLVYHESFDGASIDGEGRFTTASDKGENGILANSGTARIKASEGDNYDKRNNVLEIDAPSKATRGNYIQLENPLADATNSAYAKNKGVTISFWRHMHADCSRWLNVLNFTSYDSDHTDNRYRYATLTATGAFTFVQRDNDNGNSVNGGWMDYFPWDTDITNHSTSATTGFWTNIVLTVDPSKDTLQEGIMVYINGEPHDFGLSENQNIAEFVYANAYKGKSGDYSSLTDKEVIDAFLDFITQDSTHFDFAYGAYNDDNKDQQMWIDDIRIYTEAKTQVDINNMYSSSDTDAANAGIGYSSSTSHDPANVTVYTLGADSLSGTTYTGSKGEGDTVGQEFIDYYGVDPSTCSIEYYSFGTGLTVYKSSDNLNWTCVGDRQGRFGYQNQELFVSATGEAQPYYTTIAEPLEHAAQGTSSKNTSSGRIYRYGAAGKLVWAPHVCYNLTQDKWMYYGSTSAWDSIYSAVFLLTSDNVDYGYKYQQMIVKTSPSSITRNDGSSNHTVNGIDSCVYYGHDENGKIDPSKLYCLYGSWDDIMIKTLNADGTRSDDVTALGTLLSVARGGGEGGYMTYDNGYYYYYISPGANGWETSYGAYNIRVYRSTEPTTGFTAYNGNLATDQTDPHGNYFFERYVNDAVPYEYTNTGHSSVYKAYNSYGEEVNINSAHTREYSKGDLPVEDGALATRQIWLIGNVAIQNPYAYTSDGWPTAFPLLYDETFSLKNRTASGSERNYFTANDLDGVYTSNILDGNETTLETVEFKLFALNSNMGIIVNNNTLESHLFFVEHTDGVTYLHLKDDDGTHYGEGVIACQGTNGSANVEFSYIVEKGGSSDICKHVWGVKTGDNTSVAEIQDDIDDAMDSISEINGIGYYEGSRAVYANGDNAYGNIAYTSSTTVWGDNAAKGYFDPFYLGMPKTSVLVYTGVDKSAYLPVAISTHVQVTDRKPYLKHIDFNKNDFAVYENWYGHTASAKIWPGSVTKVDEIGYSSSNTHNCAEQNTNETRYWGNKLYFTGSFSDNEYLKTYSGSSSIQFKYYLHYTSEYFGIGADEEQTVNPNSETKIYVVNYKPIYDIVAGNTKFSGTDLVFSESLYNDIKAGKYTATSTMAFYRAMELILAANPTSAEYDYSSNTSAAIESLTANIQHALGVFNSVNLQERADLTKFDAAFDKADSFLNSLDGRISQYDMDSVVALKNALTATNVSKYAKADAETRADFGPAVQTDADNLADDINDAYDGLTPAEVDSSAYEAANTTVRNLDPEAYDETSSITNAISTANSVSTDTIEYGDSTITFVTETNQKDVDDVTNVIVSALTASVKQYDVDAADTDASEISANNGQYYTDTNKATYGTKMTFRADDPKTAWFLELSTATTHKQLTYAGSGDKFETRVLGNIKVKSVSRTDDLNCRITIIRNYDNDPDKIPVEYLNYVASGTEFTLPSAHALAFYTFKGYFIGDTQVNGTISITEDTEIIAKYEVNNDASCAINATDINNNALNSTVEYNNLVELKGGSGTYAWIEAVDETHYRPFYIGEDVSFYASESTTLKAVSEEDFNAYNFNVPTVNLRKSGTILSDNRTIFNGQVVASNIDNVRECGLLIGIPAATEGFAPDESQLILENTGTQTGYRVVRAKSTKYVGANQFSIAIKNVPAGVVYRAYVIYDNGEGTAPQTVYTDVMFN